MILGSENTLSHYNKCSHSFCARNLHNGTANNKDFMIQKISKPFLYEFFELRGIGSHHCVGVVKRKSDGIVAAVVRIVAGCLVGSELDEQLSRCFALFSQSLPETSSMIVMRVRFGSRRVERNNYSFLFPELNPITVHYWQLKYEHFRFTYSTIWCIITKSPDEISF